MPLVDEVTTTEQPSVFLWKRSKLLRVWRKRKAVLHSSGLFALYHERGSGDQALRAAIALSPECRIEHAPEAHRSLFAFRVTGPGLRIFLAADTEDEAERWMLLLGAHCRTQVLEPPLPALGAAATQASSSRGRWYDGPPLAHRRTMSGGVRVLWPHTGSAVGGPLAPSDLLNTARVLDPDALAELREWPQMHSAVLRALAAANAACAETETRANGVATADGEDASAEASDSWTKLGPADLGKRLASVGIAGLADGDCAPSLPPAGDTIFWCWQPPRERAVARQLGSFIFLMCAIACSVVAAVAIATTLSTTPRDEVSSATADVVDVASAAVPDEVHETVHETVQEVLMDVIKEVAVGLPGNQANGSDASSPSTHNLAVAAAVGAISTLLFATLSFRVHRGGSGASRALAATRETVPPGTAHAMALRCRHVSTDGPRQVLADAGCLLPSRLAWDGAYAGGRVLRRSGRHSMHIQLLLRLPSDATGTKPSDIGALGAGAPTGALREVIVQRFEATTVGGGALIVSLATTYDAHTPPLDGIRRLVAFEHAVIALPVDHGVSNGLSSPTSANGVGSPPSAAATPSAADAASPTGAHATAAATATPTNGNTPATPSTDADTRLPNSSPLGTRASVGARTRGSVIVQQISIAPRGRSEQDLGLSLVLALPRLQALKHADRNAADRSMSPKPATATGEGARASAAASRARAIAGLAQFGSAATSSESEREYVPADDAGAGTADATAEDAGGSGGLRNRWRWRGRGRSAEDDAAAAAPAQRMSGFDGRADSWGSRQPSGRASRTSSTSSHVAASAVWPAPRSLALPSSPPLATWHALPTPIPLVTRGRSPRVRYGPLRDPLPSGRWASCCRGCHAACRPHPPRPQTPAPRARPMGERRRRSLLHVLCACRPR